MPLAERMNKDKLIEKSVHFVESRQWPASHFLFIDSFY